MITQEFVEIHYTPEEVQDLLDSLNAEVFDIEHFTYTRMMDREFDTPRYHQGNIIKELKKQFNTYSIDKKLYPEMLRSFFLTIDGTVYRIVHEFLHRTDLERVPLYINNPLLSEFVKWRLKVGK
jgi:hypothetical protein